MKSIVKGLGRQNQRGLGGGTYQVHSNRYLCSNCNFITSKQGIPHSPIICPRCGRLLTRITISSH